MEEKHKEEVEVCRAAIRGWLEEQKEKESIQQEVRRLQELRRYIQEECDQLLLRKERLKEEVVLHAVPNYAALDGLMSFNSLDISLRKSGPGSGMAEEEPQVSVSGRHCMQFSKETRKICNT